MLVVAIENAHSFLELYFSYISNLVDEYVLFTNILQDCFIVTFIWRGIISLHISSNTKFAIYICEMNRYLIEQPITLFLERKYLQYAAPLHFK